MAANDLSSIVKEEDWVYTRLYEMGLQGRVARMDIPGTLYQDDPDYARQWIMGYLDGLSDGGHDVEATGFRSWLTRHRDELTKFPVSDILNT